MKIAILSGSVFGTSEQVARRAKKLLEGAGFEVYYRPQTNLAAVQDFTPEAVLVVTSTTGHGEIPDSLLPIALELRDTLPGNWRGLPGGIVALGDSSYKKTFCQAGQEMHELFEELGVREVQDMLRLDASETMSQAADAQPWLTRFGELLAD